MHADDNEIVKLFDELATVSANDTMVHIKLLCKIAEKYSSSGDHQSSICFYAKAISILSDVDDQPRIDKKSIVPKILWSIGVQYELSGDTEHAKSYATKSIEGMEKTNWTYSGWFRYMATVFKNSRHLADHGSPIDHHIGQQIPFPSFLRMAVTSIESMNQFVNSKFTVSIPTVQEKRMDVCIACEFREKQRCVVCGCFISIKITLSHEVCPLRRW